METIITIVIVVFGILQLILFIKIWGMTNDIREIKTKFIGVTNYVHAENETTLDLSDIPKKHDNQKFVIGQLLINKKTEKQLRVVDLKLTDGVIYYWDNSNEKQPEHDLADFKAYWKSK